MTEKNDCKMKKKERKSLHVILYAQFRAVVFFPLFLRVRLLIYLFAVVIIEFQAVLKAN